MEHVGFRTDRKRNILDLEVTGGLVDGVGVVDGVLRKTTLEGLC